MTETFYYEVTIAAQGAEFRGIQKGLRDDLILFADPELRSTLAVPKSEFSPETVALRLNSSRSDFTGSNRR